MGHELSSSEVIEILEATESEARTSELSELEISKPQTTELKAVEPEMPELKTSVFDAHELEIKEHHDD